METELHSEMEETPSSPSASDTSLSSLQLPPDLPPEVFTKLEALQPGTYCHHRSWGFGFIKSWDIEEGKVIIDFTEKPGHGMQFEYAAQTLTPLLEGHIFASKARDLPGLQDLAAQDPTALIRQCIQSFQAKATVDTIQEALVPDVIASADWKKWWDGTKRALRKDGHFALPRKKNEALQLMSAPSIRGEQALEEFRNAIGMKALLTAMVSLQKFWSDIREDSIADEITQKLNEAIEKMNPKRHLASMIEMAIARDEFLQEIKRDIQTGPLAVAELAPISVLELSPLIESLPGLKQTKLVESLRKSRTEEWHELALGLLPTANGRIAEIIVRSFIEIGKNEEIVTVVDRLIRERNLTCEFFYWFCKNRRDIFLNLFQPSLINAILAVLERAQLLDSRRGTKLYELILSDRQLIKVIFHEASLEDVRDVTRSILLSPVFEELDKRSLLARVIKLYPQVQSMIVKEESKQENSPLIVSWESLEARRAELEDVVQRKIPENSKEIGIARSYGDLRENHEFKAAKEMQTILMRRKEELEQLLTRAQGTNFQKVDTSIVNIGTQVHIRSKNGEFQKTYTILGAWDSDPQAGIISYLTPIAQALYKKKVGDSVEIPNPETGGNSEVFIEKIESYQ